MKSQLNEALLQQIAAATGGFYLPLRGANTMDMLYEHGLAPLPKSEGAEKLMRRYHEQYHWPLAAAMLLLLAEMFFPERRSPTRRVLKNQPYRARRRLALRSRRLLFCCSCFYRAPSGLRRPRRCAIIGRQFYKCAHGIHPAGRSADE